MKTTLILITFLFSFYAQATILEIIKLGHPTLRATAQEVSLAEIEDPKFQSFLDDMAKTMSKAGGVGLAAPQVNRSLRVFVMKSGLRVPLTIVINPKIEYLESYGTKSSSEGCLSIPGKTYTVKRYKKIHLSYFNRKGEYISEEVGDFKAIIAQHEYDHLNGVMIVDLVEQMMSTFDMEKYLKSPLM